MAADSANMVLVRQEREAAAQAETARAEAQRAREELAPVKLRIG